MNTLKLNRNTVAGAIALALISQSNLASASPTTLGVEATADTMITDWAPQINSDMSSYGAMMISAPLSDIPQGVSQVRSMESIIAYNTASFKTAFDNTYGVNNWHVTDVQLKLYTNFDIPGVPANNNQFNVPAHGSFNLSLMDNNSWFNPAKAGATGLDNGDVTWNSIYAGGKYSSLFSTQTAEGTFAYTDYPNGNSNGTTDCFSVADSCDPRMWDLALSSALVTDIKNGSYVSFHGTAADSQVSYLINQLTKPGAHPQIFITADAGLAEVPVPAALWMFLSGLMAYLGFGDRRSAVWKIKSALAA